MNRHLILDLNNLAHRASAKDPGLTNTAGVRTGTVFGMLRMIKTLCHDFKPVSITVCEDSGYNQERLKFFPEYKFSRRQKKVDRTKEEEDSYIDFVRQRNRFLEYAQNAGIRILKYDYTEADDIIGYIAHLANITKPFTYEGNMKHKLLIVSTDNDFMHLVSPCVDYYSPVRNQVYTYEHVNPTLELFKKSINGDPGDGIAGVPGVGEKTIQEAFETIKFTGDRDEFYRSCSVHSNNRVKKIAEGRELVERNTKIISLLYTSGFVRNLPSETKLGIKNSFFNTVSQSNYDSLLKLSYEDDFKSIFTNIKSFFWWVEHLK